MRACLFNTIQSQRGRESESVRRFLRRVEWADAAGFDAVFLGERHFTGYGVIGNPTVFASAVAARTERIKIGFAALILALHNPYRLADELVMLDTLSNGRLIIGVGTGNSIVEFGALGIDREQRRDRFYEALDVLDRVWKGDPFEHSGPIFPASFPGLTLRPIQQPIPLARAASSKESLTDAAQRRIPLLNGRFFPETIARNMGIYTGALRNSGASEADIARLTEQCGFLRYIVVARTDAEAHRIARQALAGYIERANEVFEPHDLDAWYPEAVTAGTPESVLEQLRSFAPIGRLLGWFDFGDIDPDTADASLNLFIREVLPHLPSLEPAVPV